MAMIDGSASLPLNRLIGTTLNFCKGDWKMKKASLKLVSLGVLVLFLFQIMPPMAQAAAADNGLASVLQADNQEASAIPVQKVIRYYIGEAKYLVNDQMLSMETEPLIIEGRIMIPANYIVNPLGASVAWDEQQHKVTVKLDGKIIAFWINKHTAMIDGCEKSIDPDNDHITSVIGPLGTTMLPLRFIAENLDCQVSWDTAQNTITIVQPIETTIPAAGKETTIKIGALLPLTGIWNEAGQGAEKALKVGLPMVNYSLKDSGIQLELDIRDSESNPEKALQQLECLHKAGINTVLGPMTSEESMKVIKYADDNSMLLLSPSATSTDLSLKDNFYRVIASDKNQIDGLTRVINTYYKTKRLIAVYIDDTYGRGYYGELQKQTKTSGISVIGGIPLAVSSPDYALIVNKMEQLISAQDAKETAIVLISSGENAAQLIKNIPADSRLSSLKWFVSAEIVGSKIFLEDKAAAGFAAKTGMEGLTVNYKDLDRDALPYIGQVLEGAADLSPYAITSWDSLWLLAETIMESPGKDIESLKQTLPEAARCYQNAMGSLNVMDENGDTVGARFMRYQLQAQGDQYVWRFLGHYVNLGQGEPIIKQLQWTAAADGGKVPVGALLPLSGSVAEKGKEVQSILNYAVQRFNQYAGSCGSNLQLQLVVEDTGSDPQKALTAAQKMIDMGIRNIIGPLSSSELEKIKPLVDADKIILISPLSTSPSLAAKDYIYRLVPSDIVQTRALAALIKQDGKKRIVLLKRNDTYGNEIDRALQKNFAGEIISLSYNPQQPDIAGLIQNAQKAVQAGNAAETAVLAASYEEIVDIFKQIPDNSNLINIRWYGTDGTALSNALIEDQKAAPQAVKVNFTASDYTPYGQRFDPLYQVINYKLQPAHRFKESSLCVFDGLWLLGCAYLEKGTSAAADVINEYVANNPFRGVGGVLAFDENGDRRFSYYKFYQVGEHDKKYNWNSTALYSEDYLNQGRLEILP